MTLVARQSSKPSGCGPRRQRPGGRSGFSSVACRSARNAVQRGSGAQLGALLEHQPLELLDAQLLDQELDAGARRGSPSRRGARTRGTSPAPSAAAPLRAGTRRTASPAAAPRRARRRRTARSRARSCRRPSRVRAMQPMSWKLVRPQALSLQPENATLNLRPKSWVSSWPSRKNVSALRVGRDVERLGRGRRRRCGQAVTLRTVLPHASRVVMPTAASRRMQVGRVLDVDEVELDVLAGGDVQDAVRVLLGQLGQHVQLRRRSACRTGS